MVKRIVYTDIAPLPNNVPRQLALDMLHSHGEVISLNPLVTGQKAIEAPRDASADEYFAQWYEICEIITWGFGLKKKISFKGCFHDLPNGLQTHVYAPMGVDLRQKFQIRGNQPGEPREVRELGIDAPAEGLYLRYDVEIVCNLALSPFVKKETKAATGTMMERMARKAELLDEGALHAMFENGRLKTVNPAQAGGQIQHQDAFKTLPPGSPNPSTPGTPPAGHSDSPDKKFTKYSDLPGRQSSQSNRSSYLPSYQQPGYKGPENPPIAELGGQPYDSNAPVEVEGSYYFNTPQSQQSNQGASFRSELADTSVPSASLHPDQAYQQKPGSTQPGAQQPYSQSSHSSPEQRYSSSDPRPAPLKPHRSSTASNPGYNQYENQDRNRASSTGSAYGATNTDEGFYSRNPSQRSASSHATSQRDSQLQGLSSQVHGLGLSTSPRLNSSQFGTNAAFSRCPVCEAFEGDEAAVSHHVQVKHFS